MTNFCLQQSDKRSATGPATQQRVAADTFCSASLAICGLLQFSRNGGRMLSTMTSRCPPVISRMRDTGTMFSLKELDRHFLDLLRQLEESGECERDTDCPPLITKEQWLQTQLVTIQKLSHGEEL
jgi:hypothetical protein